MSAEASVRIERLDLKVGHRDLVNPFRNDFEDALRTADMPRLPTGARLFIRKLRLGRIPAGIGRQALSRYLDMRLASVDYVLALPGALPPADTDAVLVADLVTGAAIALDAITVQQPLPWYLQELFPHLGGSPASSALLRIVDILMSEAGPQAVGRLADSRNGGFRLMRLLNGLPEGKVKTYLAELGEIAPDQSASSATTDMVYDNRDLKPPAPDRQLAAPAEMLEAILLHAGAEARREIILAAAELPINPERLSLLAAWLAIAHAGPQAARPAMARLRGMLAGADTFTTPRRQGATDVAVTSIVGPRATTDVKRSRPPPPAPDTALPPASPVAMAISEALAEPSPFEGAFSNHAGLWLLLAALRLVGLDTAEQATGLPLGHIILSGLADRLGLGETDPARSCLAPEFAGELNELRPWLPRSDVLRLISGGRDLHFTRMTPGKALIRLRHGDGILAVAGPGEMRRIRASGCGLHPSVFLPTDISLSLRRGLMLATQQLVSRATGKGWRQLAARRGRIVATATHIDIEFDGRDVDPAVRIAGLDLDPGWVPWLGRVVCFHYDYSRVRDFPAGPQP